MLESRFDPSHAVRFDLARGAVELQGSVPQVLVPMDALFELGRGAGAEALGNFGRRLGTEIGRRIAERLGDGLGQAGPETLVEHLGGELALVGLGSMGLERWGRAIVITFRGGPNGPDAALLLGAVVEGALQRATSRDLKLLPVPGDAEVLRLLVLHPSVADRASQWASQGAGLPEIVERLSSSRGGS